MTKPKLLRPLTQIAFTTLYAMWQYVTVGLPPCDCINRIETVATGTDVPPLAYRILIPKLLYALGNTKLTLVLFQAVMFTVFFALVLVWCRQQDIPTVTALLALLIAITIMMPTFYFGVYTVFEWNILLCTLLYLSHLSLSQR